MNGTKISKVARTLNQRAIDLASTALGELDETPDGSLELTGNMVRTYSGDIVTVRSH
jgi:hypothetical protein